MRPYKVLVADDCREETAVLCEGLKLNGYEAVGVLTGAQAIARCADGDIDLLLLDIGLPDISGHEVCKRLKENKKTKDIPIIFVTARGEAVDIAQGYALGAVDYITKPYNLPFVMIRVESAMRTRQTNDYLAASVELLQDPIYTDHLTGLRNRRFLLERLQEEIEKSHRYDYPVACVVLDVDEIRAVDEEMGGASLDDLLVEIALSLRNSSRTHDILARYEGALFVAVLPHARLKDAIGYANKIQEEVTATTYSDPSFPTRAKLSFGIVACRNGHSRNADEVLAEAMRNLFHAATHPGNRIVAKELNAPN